jgi:tetraacyldisaccharide 4'-kinase
LSFGLRRLAPAGWADRLWYGRRRFVWPLLPLSALFCAGVWLRRQAYFRGWLRRVRLEVPVVVVGNIVVGGAGKTPLVAWLANYVAEAGWRPGIVSRGYGGRSREWPRDVTAESDAAEVGDEPVLLARRCPCPVAVGPDRVSAARRLVELHGCNLIVCDDGLQHYALERDVEVVVLDGVRRFGNGCCLPAGPLREPPSGLRRSGVVSVCNGGVPGPGELGMRLAPGALWNLRSPGTSSTLGEFAGREVHAVAGIANPARFFGMLEAAGMRIHRHPYPDHHRFLMRDIDFADCLPVLMTEKDAVKCSSFADRRHWAVPVAAIPDPALGQVVLDRLRARRAGTSIPSGLPAGG